MHNVFLRQETAVLYADTAVASELLGPRDLCGVLVNTSGGFLEGCIACLSCEKT